MQKIEKILVVAAHPDDEVLGCGGTVGKRVLKGDEAYLLTMTRGVAGRLRNNDSSNESPELKRRKSVLQDELKKASSVIGFKDASCLDFPDNRMDTISRMDIAHEIRAHIERHRPTIVMTHHPGDYNWDHTMTFDAVMMAARTSPGEFSPRQILAFEVPSSTERAWQNGSRVFQPNVWVDISKTIDRKKLALRYYESEYREYPHPRSIEAIEHLARKRGYEVGIEYAEAFELIRSLET